MFLKYGNVDNFKSSSRKIHGLMDEGMRDF